MTFEVTFWGTRGSRPTPTTRSEQTLRFGGNTSCAGVRTPSGDLIILDSGTGIAELGNTLEGESVDALLLITHTHWDHIQGLPFFGPLHTSGTRLDVRGPRPAAGSLGDALMTQMSANFFPVHLNECAARMNVSDIVDTAPFEWRGIRITPHLLNHTTPTLGFRLDADAASLVYATDNELRPLIDEAHANGRESQFGAMVTWTAGADLLIHDTQYTDAEYVAKRGWGHSTATDVMRLRTDAAVARLALWHHDPAHSDADMERIVGECAPGDSTVFAAAEGDAVQVGEGSPVR